MNKECIETPSAPPAMGPYTHVVAAGNLLFISGQVPLSPNGGGLVRGEFDAEARQVLSNLKAVVEDAGSSLENVVKVTVFLADIDNFPAFNKVYGEFFQSDCPARSCVEVARLPADVQVEVEAIALRPQA